MSRFIRVNAVQEMKAGGTARKLGRSGATALVLGLPVVLAGCEHVASDIPRGWNLVLAVCFVVVVGPIYLFLRQLIANLLPEITFRAWVIGGAVLFVVLLAWLRFLALHTPQLP